MRENVTHGHGRVGNQQKYFCPTVDVDKLWSLVSEQMSTILKDRALAIDVVKAITTRSSAKGVLPKQPVIVKAKFFSRSAEAKIKCGRCLCACRLKLL